MIKLEPTFNLRPVRPAITPSAASTTVDVSTSPAPDASMRSMTFTFPSVVTWKNKFEVTAE